LFKHILIALADLVEYTRLTVFTYCR